MNVMNTKNNIINGKVLASTIISSLHNKVSDLGLVGVVPYLHIIVVGDNDASQIYVRNKAKRASEIGIKTHIQHLSYDVSENELVKTIHDANDNSVVHGIIIQLPLPKHISVSRVINEILPTKDVDGFHPLNVGMLYSGLEPMFLPCTPKGCLAMIQSVCPKIDGMNAVVIGRSNIVGRPMASLLLKNNATISLCHSHTNDIKKFTREADIVVCAVGSAKIFDKSYFKDGVIVIDVGINRLDNKTLCGDVDFNDVAPIAGYISPVPNGVGPMTIACLMDNVVAAAIRITKSVK
jgi:methylenetetrahydrofolate dehydrogenase (NADP+)/methenyltetrahydrofolate cyclohydrolase